MKISNPSKLIISIAGCLLAGVLGSAFTGSAIGGWYSAIEKPAINPPNWVFGPVWTTLYILMGVSAYLIWKKGLEKKQIKTALTVFIVQLVLNSLWSIIFFGLGEIGWAFAEIILLWISILVTIILFFRISKPAGIILIPYLLWVTFAGYLNFLLWVLNQAFRAQS